MLIKCVACGVPESSACVARIVDLTVCNTIDTRHRTRNKIYQCRSVGWRLETTQTAQTKCLGIPSIASMYLNVLCK